MKSHKTDGDSSYRHVIKDFERYQPGGRKRRTLLAQRAIMWDVHHKCVFEGLATAKTAEMLGMSVGHCQSLLRKAKYAIDKADEFDTDAQNIRKEMLKFMPLAAEALKENLLNAEPRVTVAFFQGTGALVNREEIDVLTDEERKAHEQRSIAAMNPRMRAALGITEVSPADVVITTKKAE